MVVCCARKFPKELVLGAESVLARVLWERQQGLQTAPRLAEIVQMRFFTAAGEPNPLSASGRQRPKNQGATLVLTDECALQTKDDQEWQPKSTLAMLDCLDSWKAARLLMESSPDSRGRHRSILFVVQSLGAGPTPEDSALDSMVGHSVLEDCAGNARELNLQQSQRRL